MLLTSKNWCNEHGYIKEEETMPQYGGDCDSPKEGPIKQEPLKKYYVGAKHIAGAIIRGGNASCMRETLEEARAEAIAQVESEEVDCAVVVEIKLIVRKPKKPVDIQEV